jgi:hypothetical protein
MRVSCLVAAALTLVLAACSDGEEPDGFPTGVSEAGASTSDAGAARGPDGGAFTPGGPGTGGDAGSVPSLRDATTPSDATNPTPSQPDASRVDASTGGKPDASTATDAGGSTQPDSGGGGPRDPRYPPITDTGCTGVTSRYWDCCKPHCGWSRPEGSLQTCNQSDGSWGSNFNEKSACDGGGAFMCHGNVPWSVSDTLSFGFAAVTAGASAGVCGKCYQLQFTGRSTSAGNDPGSAALAGKTMVVQATNIGGDVSRRQFDLLIPGGGVGKFNACSSQWGMSALGEQYGGFLLACKKSGVSEHGALKNCVMQHCNRVFGTRLSKLAAGCRWFVEWFEVADNPDVVFKQVACPEELKSRGVNRNFSPSSTCSI